MKQYDVIVVGAGHAGCEAAASAAQLGSKVLLLTMNMNSIGQMSCNPAMGGVAKGQIIREIDALGGFSGIISDRSAIQFRMLNRSKGPAMWSPRTQNDRVQFSLEWRYLLESQENIDFWQDMVIGLMVKNGVCFGVTTQMGNEFIGKSVILTNGTFLNGLLHIGRNQLGGGRAGESRSTGITEHLTKLGFEFGRMKTGTPPRIDGRSINYAKLEVQEGDQFPTKFSFLESTKPVENQLCCHITYTNDEVHDILRKGFEDSPLYNGTILSVGPRYCPSIEDKINRFSDKNRHQLFVEPEGRNTIEVYLNGFSTSLPIETQQEALKKIAGFENSKMFRPGYAIEYDYFPPQQLNTNLETKLIKNLFFAGQINGTTGYEEAAAQGLMAGINAHNAINNLSPFVLKRSEAYIGVLIDDLILKGTDEPYRMFTSRAEYRILLRQDNADLRLTKMGKELGLASSKRYSALEKKIESVKSIKHYLNEISCTPEEVNPVFLKHNSSPIDQKTKLINVVLRPDLSIFALTENIETLRDYLSQFDHASIEEAEIQIKYSGYIERERLNAEKLTRLEDVKIKDLDYSKINSLSIESRQKLNKFQPSTIGQASRISGVSPSDVSILLVHLGR